MSTVGIVGKPDSTIVIADTVETDALTRSVYGPRSIAKEVLVGDTTAILGKEVKWRWCNGAIR